MKQSVIRSMPLMLASFFLVTGCSESDRVARIAIDAAQRQAQQNTDMVKLNREVAQGTRRLVEADAEARKEIIIVHQDLQAERAALSDGFDSLESERRQIAEQRKTESLLVLAAKTVGGILMAALVTGFCWALLIGHRSRDESDAVLNELLICNLIAEHPRLLNEPSENTATVDGHDPSHSER